MSGGFTVDIADDGRMYRATIRAGDRSLECPHAYAFFSNAMQWATVMVRVFLDDNPRLQQYAKHEAEYLTAGEKIVLENYCARCETDAPDPAAGA